ncbi:hypothetical protein [Agrobacterium leguminum]|jgi:hypothetical protein|uniref:hypothetical protein n=1 Tax=Agrobacterium leguminum TaxID=2792015 RepID=UPI003CE4ADE4
MAVTEQGDGGKRRMGRSPAYPTISLDKALGQVRALRDREGDYPAPLTSAFAAWGHSAKSSAGRQTLATLKYYGLIDISGEGDSRKVRISALGRKILLDEREDQTEKQNNIRAAALNPAIHKALFAEYPNGLASDSTVRHFLIFNQGFNEDAASELIAEFQRTALFSDLYGKSNGLDNNSSLEPKFKIGDFVNWESAGQIQWREPRQLTDIQKHSDGKFFYRVSDTDDREGWIPEDQAILAERSEGEKNLPPPPPPSSFKPLAPSKVQTGFREEKVSLDEGEATILMPENLSTESVSDLEYWLEGIIRRAKRRAGVASSDATS